MTDIVIAVPRANWAAWLAEQGPDDRRGRRRGFQIFGEHPPCSAGDTLYVASHGRLRCAFEIETLHAMRGGWFIVGLFVRPVTIHAFLQGFPGWRRRTWHPAEETPFPAWRTEAVSTGHAPSPLAHGKTPSEHAGSSA